MKKNKLLLPVVAAALLLGLTACGGGQQGGGGGGGGTNGSLRATLHFEDADHEAADGWWHGSQSTYATPIRSDRDGASDGTCISRFSEGDKETLTFTSDKAAKAELVVTMYSSDSVTIGDVLEAKFNDKALALEEVEYAPAEEEEEETETASSGFLGVSFGMVDLVAGDNKLAINFLGSAPDLDDLKIYSKDELTIAVKASTKQALTPAQTKLEMKPGDKAQITFSNTPAPTGVTYTTNREAIAIVSETGEVEAKTVGECEISASAPGFYSAVISVVITQPLVDGEIRLEAEDADPMPSGFMKLTDRTSGINTGHSGGAYITGYQISDEVSLEYTFESPKDQVMTLVIACSPSYQMSEDFSFAELTTITVNEVEVKAPDTAVLLASEAGMGAQTRDLTIGDVNVVKGANTFVITFHGRAPALDVFKFVPKA